ncbi:plant invertase/pectin methylesterase inhibitor [Striga asiatica]|uniref:Plant invertase/pectin methylesterase inhibitor n=1 Tax=Striga asiatica TaxID=4170 RepID=A0A5A7QWH0_STRAF|nr:plant invertase/pectin methylesterase inhibitor [Striga asiatica]
MSVCVISTCITTCSLPNELPFERVHCPNKAYIHELSSTFITITVLLSPAKLKFLTSTNLDFLNNPTISFTSFPPHSSTVKANPTAPHRPLHLPHESAWEKGPIQVQPEPEIKHPIKEWQVVGIRPGHQRRRAHQLHSGDFLHPQFLQGPHGVARPGGDDKGPGVVREVVSGLEGRQEGGIGGDGAFPGVGGPETAVALVDGGVAAVGEVAGGFGETGVGFRVRVGRVDASFSLQKYKYQIQDKVLATVTTTTAVIIAATVVTVEYNSHISFTPRFSIDYDSN